MKHTLFVETTYRIVATIKGHQLTYPETVMVQIELNNLLFGAHEFDMARPALLAVVETGVRMKLAEGFVTELKTNTETKRRIGGTKWSVDLVGSIEEMPFYTEVSAVGDYKKFVRTKNPIKTQKDIVHRNSAILKGLASNLQSPLMNYDDLKQAA